jgi:site-specific recombinase XerC
MIHKRKMCCPYVTPFNGTHSNAPARFSWGRAPCRLPSSSFGSIITSTAIARTSASPPTSGEQGRCCASAKWKSAGAGFSRSNDQLPPRLVDWQKGLIVLKGGVPGDQPLEVVGPEREHIELDRGLPAEEFARLCEPAEDWLKPILVVAYHTGMRKDEICALRWDQVGLKMGTIRLKSSDTKTAEGRVIPMSQTLTSTRKTATRYVSCPWVFVNPARIDTWQASPDMAAPRYHKTSLTHAFERACQKAGVKNATFHDLHHTFVTNARRAGIDYFRIMAITGHKTMAVLKRYDTANAADLQQAIRQINTDMDTSLDVATASDHVTPRNNSRSRRSSAGRATDS